MDIFDLISEVASMSCSWRTFVSVVISIGLSYGLQRLNPDVIWPFFTAIPVLLSGIIVGRRTSKVRAYH